MKTVKISVTGKVQGVFFRSETQKKANELGLDGWVKNEPDGTVTIIATGEESLINELIQWCASNPGASQVRDMDIKELSENEKVDKGFTIKH